MLEYIKCVFQNPFMGPFSGYMGMPPGNQTKSPLESLFGKPRFTGEDIPPNMSDIIGTLSKMTVQVIDPV